MVQYVSLRASSSGQQDPEVRWTVCICIEPGTTTLIAAPRAQGTSESIWSPKKNQRVGKVEVSFHRVPREASRGSPVVRGNLCSRFQVRPRLSKLTEVWHAMTGRAKADIGSTDAEKNPPHVRATLGAREPGRSPNATKFTLVKRRRGR